MIKKGKYFSQVESGTLQVKGLVKQKKRGKRVPKGFPRPIQIETSSRSE